MTLHRHVRRDQPVAAAGFSLPREVAHRPVAAVQPGQRVLAVVQFELLDHTLDQLAVADRGRSGRPARHPRAPAAEHRPPHGTGPRKLSEQFCWLAPLTRHLVFGFYYGTELPDPTGLLEGTGRLMRHVKVRTPQELHDPALRRLVQVATHRVPPLPDP